MKLVYGLIILFILASCKTVSESEALILQQNMVVDNIQYIKDNRTNICFAYYSGGPHQKALATVPCEKVISKEDE